MLCRDKENVEAVYDTREQQHEAKDWLIAGCVTDTSSTSFSYNALCKWVLPVSCRGIMQIYDLLWSKFNHIMFSKITYSPLFHTVCTPLNTASSPFSEITKPVLWLTVNDNNSTHKTLKSFICLPCFCSLKADAWLKYMCTGKDRSQLLVAASVTFTGSQMLLAWLQTWLQFFFLWWDFWKKK